MLLIEPVNFFRLVLLKMVVIVTALLYFSFIAFTFIRIKTILYFQNGNKLGLHNKLFGFVKWNLCTIVLAWIIIMPSLVDHDVIYLRHRAFFIH